jgi:exodeoxyribonuclease-1
MVVRKLQTLTPAMAERWGVDMALALRHAEVAAGLPDMSAIWPEVFAREKGAVPDVDEDLYGGFVGDADRRRLLRLRAMPPAELASSRVGFDDERLQEMLFRYRARNFPDTLSPEDVERWETHRAARLLEGEAGARNMDSFLAELDVLAETADARGEEILGALSDYAEFVAPSM